MNLKIIKKNLPFLIVGFLIGGIVATGHGFSFLVLFVLVATTLGSKVASGLFAGDNSSTKELLRAQGDARALREERDRLQKILPVHREIEKLEHDRQTITDEIGYLKEDRQNLELRIQQIKLSNSNLEVLEQRQQEFHRLQAAIQERQGTAQALEHKIQQQEQRYQDLQSKVGEVAHQEGILQELKQRIQDLNQQAAELELFRSTYDALKTEATTLESKKVHLQAEIQRLAQEHDRLLNDIKSIEGRAQEMDQLRRIVDELEAKQRNQQSILRSLNRKLSDRESESELLDSKISEQKNISLKLNQKLRELKGEIAEIESSAQQAFRALETPIAIDAKQQSAIRTENEFLQQFNGYLQQKGLVFPQRIINAFHTSLKVQDISALVILAGISGTGKSELPQAYAEFMGAPLVMLPVQPRWDSPQDLQGFYNYIEKKYKPTPLMRYLYQHQRQHDLQGRMVMVLLDEMNLARVEYYFSDFLSKLETRRNRPTFLELEAGDIQLRDDQKQVPIPPEFLFVGTMNEDETTQSLSDKVLDRANVLTFGRPQELKLRSNNGQRPAIPKEYLDWQVFQSWLKDPHPILVSEVQSSVNEANEIMESLGRPFAHRVFQ